MNDHTCPLCGNPAGADPVEIGRKRLQTKSWGGSPALHFGGVTHAELDLLQSAGLAVRNRDGWWIPTDLGRMALA